MIRRSSLVILATIFTVTMASAGTADPRFEGIDSVFEKWDRTDSPGCSVGVYERDDDGVITGFVIDAGRVTGILFVRR
jgi:hypothetical protein